MLATNATTFSSRMRADFAKSNRFVSQIERKSLRRNSCLNTINKENEIFWLQNVIRDTEYKMRFHFILNFQRFYTWLFFKYNKLVRESIFFFFILSTTNDYNSFVLNFISYEIKYLFNIWFFLFDDLNYYHRNIKWT